MNQENLVALKVPEDGAALLQCPLISVTVHGRRKFADVEADDINVAQHRGAVLCKPAP